MAWSHGSRFDLARRLVAAGQGGRLLDYGCGDGTFVAMVHAGFAESCGVDVEPDQIAALVRDLAAEGCQVILTNGGTGIARRDSTFEAIDALIEKRLPGFGELFRMLSYAEIGPAAMLSRATAGTFGAALIFCLPGSTGAVRLAMERLIIPELPHLVWETLRQ